VSQEADSTDPRVAKALAHPLRVQALAVLERAESSPSQIASELGAPLGNVSYHVRELFRLGLIELVRTAPRRGAVEHFYRAHTQTRIRAELTVDERGVRELSKELDKVADRLPAIEAAAAKRLAKAGRGRERHVTVVSMVVERGG